MEFFSQNISLVLFLPLILCAIIGFNALLSNKIDKTTLFWTSAVASLICVVFSGAVFSAVFFGAKSIETSFPWLSLESLNFYFGTFLDKTSVSFLFLVSILNFLIQIFSYLKLQDLKEYTRLLFYLNLFAFGLTGCFISPNIFQTYVFCEITGVASYLMINFDFSNREESKAGIKSFIYNRIGDLTLLFCVLTILYYALVYNRLTGENSLAYSNMENVSASINSLMTVSVFVFFCSVLIFVIVMKFMQAFIYITFETKQNSGLSKIVLAQNSLITMIGIYLFLRLNPFFFDLGINWTWTILVLAVLFILLGFLNKFFVPFCKAMGWIEKYIVDSFMNFAELVIRGFSYLCSKLQGGNFQSYLIYSLAGLVLILAFVLIFYVTLIKV